MSKLEIVKRLHDTAQAETAIEKMTKLENDLQQLPEQLQQAISALEAAKSGQAEALAQQIQPLVLAISSISRDTTDALMMIQDEAKQAQQQQMKQQQQIQSEMAASTTEQIGKISKQINTLQGSGTLIAKIAKSLRITNSKIKADAQKQMLATWGGAIVLGILAAALTIASYRYLQVPLQISIDAQMKEAICKIRN